VYTYICTYDSYLYTYVYTYMCICIYTCVYIYTFIYMYICIYIILTHMYDCAQPSKRPFSLAAWASVCTCSRAPTKSCSNSNPPQHTGTYRITHEGGELTAQHIPKAHTYTHWQTQTPLFVCLFVCLFVHWFSSKIFTSPPTMAST